MFTLLSKKIYGLRYNVLTNICKIILEDHLYLTTYFTCQVALTFYVTLFSHVRISSEKKKNMCNGIQQGRKVVFDNPVCPQQLP